MKAGSIRTGLMELSVRSANFNPERLSKSCTVLLDELWVGMPTALEVSLGLT